jgi:ribosomal protein S18 acetylase RimI-like enzyme
MTIKRYRVIMIHDDIKQSKVDISLPEGYYFAKFKSGDESVWADIEVAAGEFQTKDDALKRFHDEFGSFELQLQSRCFFLCNSDGEPVGTSMGWYDNDFNGEKLGRLHWVAIKPEYQGKRLGKPLVAMAVKRIQEFHDKAYLTTQTTSWKAINMYLDFGFRPFYTSEDCKAAWGLLAEKLKHPGLE